MDKYLTKQNSLNDSLNTAKNQKENIEKYLAQNNLSYITHLQDKTSVLLCQTKTNLETLENLAEKVYLAGPSTQIYLFLSDKHKKSVFSIANYQNHDYRSYLNKVQQNLKGFFTYDIVSSQMIIKSFQNAKDKDFAYALENEDYGDNLKKLKSTLKNFLIGKTVTVDKNLSRILFKLNDNNEELLPEDLSHGELRISSIFV